MSAMPAFDDDSSERFSLIEMDPIPGQGCKRCDAKVQLNAELLCRNCHQAITAATAPAIVEVAETDDEPPDMFADVAPSTLVGDLTAIATQGAANAAVQGAGSLRGGQLAGVGFTSRDGYITALRNRVKGGTYQEYVNILRTRYGMTSGDITKLGLPGPMAESTLPVGKGIVHTPAGPSIFDRPKTERTFVVGPKPAEVERAPDVSMSARELVAGAVAEGHHAILAWEGTSGMTRGELVAALQTIGREAWAPKAPNARAQAGTAIAALGKGGLDVKALRKGGSVAGADLASGEHVWTVGRIGHGAKVGDAYGSIVCRFKLSGTTLTFEGDNALGNPVVAEFQARMSSELFKSSDITSWLSRTLRWQLDGVKFGALGWLVPAKHVAAAKQLTEAIGRAGFGTGWVHGLPVAMSD